MKPIQRFGKRCLSFLLLFTLALPACAAAEESPFPDVTGDDGFPDAPVTQDISGFDGTSARPAIRGGVENLAQYDVIFLGYPIWHGQAPRILSTFLESYDLSGKTIVPFCTSGSSGLGSSAANLHALAPSAQWLEGERFFGSASRDSVEHWVSGLDLPTGQN